MSVRRRSSALATPAALVALAALLLVPAAARAQLLDAKVVSLEAAKRIATAAEAEARKNNWRMSIAVVDAAGQLIVFERMDDASPASLEVAIGKARTSARFKRETRLMDSSLAAGRLAMLGLPDVVPVEGGVPIRVGDRVIGAVGVSGGSSAQDAQVARAGLAVLVP